MLVTLLADIDLLCIPPRQVQYRRGNQAVIDNHICHLHQAQCTESQQIRIPGTGTDQVNFTDGIGLIAGLLQRLFKQLASRVIAPGNQQFGHFTLQNILPEPAPLVATAEALFDPVAETFHQCRQATIRGRNIALQARTQQARQHR